MQAEEAKETDQKREVENDGDEGLKEDEDEEGAEQEEKK